MVEKKAGPAIFRWKDVVGAFLPRRNVPVSFQTESSGGFNGRRNGGRREKRPQLESFFENGGGNGNWTIKTGKLELKISSLAPRRCRGQPPVGLRDSTGFGGGKGK